MSSHKLIAEVAERGHAMRIAAILQDLMEPPPDALSIFEDAAGGEGEHRWRIEAYFSEPRAASAVQSEIMALTGEPAPDFRSDAVPDLNWVALSQAALPPVNAGRFTVHGAHDRSRVPQGPNAILIEAGEAFGTAHHATTYGCLAAIDQLGRSGAFKRILDLGCGSGILSIAAARVWPAASITGVDIDPQSVLVARENARVNGTARHIRFLAGAGVAHPEVRRAAPFDLIIANILAGPLIALAPDLRRSAAAGGQVLLSGLLTREASLVTAAYTAQSFALLSHRRYDGWSTLLLVNRAS